MITRSWSFFVLALLILAPINYGCSQSRSHMFSLKRDRDQGWLGVMVQDVTGRVKEKKGLTVDAGALVTEVIDESPAEEAGIKEGDVIVKFDGRSIDDADELTRAVRRTKPRADIKIEIVREEGKKTLSAVIGRVPRSSSYSFNFDDNFPRAPRAPMRMHIFRQSEFQGLEVQDLNRQLAEFFEVPGGKGVLVSEVEKKSDAEKGGFKAGDVIIKANGNSVRDIDDLRDEFREVRRKETMSFEIIRKGKSVNLSMTLADDGDDESFEYDDDDLSFNVPSPPHVPHLRRFDFHIPHFRHEDLDRLRENLMKFRDGFRLEMQKFRRNLKEELLRI